MTFMQRLQEINNSPSLALGWLKEAFAACVSKLGTRIRAWPWLAASFVGLIVVAIIAPWQVGVLIWSLMKLTFAVYLGYWVWRSLHPYARPHELYGPARDNAVLARAIIIAAAMIALGLGV
jgi:hypothetical protein